MANWVVAALSLALIIVATGVNAVGSTDQTAEPCASEPCENGAACQRFNAAFICFCADGFIGSRCELNASQITENTACESNPCNGGVCNSAGVDRYTCMCPKGLAGQNCERDIDECAQTSPNICPNGTLCINSPGSYTCLNLTCADNPCLNGGSCTQHVDSSPVCTCTDGFTGNICETSTTVADSCSSSPCLNEGMCVPSKSNPTQFTCQCRSGSSGELCQVRLHVVCLFDGISFNEGDTRYDDCNECYCQRGSWFCTKNFCGKIHGSFKFTGDYESIDSEVKEFSRLLQEDLTKMFSIPMNMMTELKVSSGSIQVDFTLESLRLHPDVRGTAEQLETALSSANYTFTFHEEVFGVDPSSVDFKEEPNQRPSEAPNTTSPTGPADSVVLIVVVALCIVLIFVMLLCVVKICVKRHKAKTKARQYQLGENGDDAPHLNNSNQVRTTMQNNHLYAVIDTAAAEAAQDVDEGVSVDMDGSGSFHTYERPRPGSPSPAETLPVNVSLEYKTLEPYTDRENDNEDDKCLQMEKEILSQTEL